MVSEEAAFSQRPSRSLSRAPSRGVPAPVETRNRKPMRPNPLAPWELRVERLRVYYDVQDEPERIAQVRAVGVKRRHLVRIGGEVIEL